jgi:predicted DCC family thiol-disulfide oxidoreductase YuxK
LVENLDSYNRLDFVPLTQADKEGILDAVPAEARHKSFHLISPAGEPLSGANAIPTLVALLPSGTLLSRFIKSAPGGLRATSFLYAVLSRLHNTETCRYKSGQTHEHTGRPGFSNQRFGFLR